MSPSRRSILLLAVLLCASLTAACSSAAKPEKVYTLADISLTPGDDAADTTPWTFGQDAAGELGDVLSDAAPNDAAAVDGAQADATDDADALSSDGAPPVDVQKPPITSCKGLCGQFVEDGACHCNAGCVAAKNCCDDYAVQCSCSTAVDCNDGNDCTTDTCDKGFCKQIPFLGCCTSDADCTGGTACKPATCTAGSCSLQAKNCDDGLACTTDVCDPSDGSCVHKLQVDKCEIDGKCFNAKDPDPTSNGCGTCDPKTNQLAWAVTPNKCLIDGACVSSGTVSPTAACASCDPTKSTAAWTVAAGQCLIGGVCVATAAVADGSFGCKVCDPVKSTSAWAIKIGSCNDTNVCTTGDACDPKGACVGKPKAGCCSSDADCAGVQPPPGVCQMAACVSGTCVVQADPNCCTSGVCCNVSTQTLQPAGTVCDTTTVVDTQYQCSAGGDAVQKRNQYYGCNGTSPNKCTSSTPAWGPWKTSLQCSSGDVCTPGTGSQPTCQTPP